MARNLFHALEAVGKVDCTIHKPEHAHLPRLATGHADCQ
jgi:hypothetical protein